MKAIAFIILVAAGTLSAFAQDCSPGYFSDGGSCKKCAKGTFQSLPGQSGCKPCPDGTVSTEDGRIMCISCTGEHKVPSESKTECVCRVGAVTKKNGSCELCYPGTSVGTGKNRRICLPCRRGFYQPDEGQTSCLQCPPGTDSGYGAIKCLACKDGEVNILGECGVCPAGEFPEDDRCNLCDEDSFKPEKGNAPCLPCPPGTEAKNPGATRCTPKPCGNGTVPLKKGKCGTCPPGTYYNKYRRSCPKCAKNTFMPYESTANSCFDCAGSSFTNKKGASECIKCALGEGLFKDGTCGTCPGGQYYDEHDQKCVLCGINDYGTGPGGTCKSCPDGSFATPGSTTCFACPGGQALIMKNKRKGNCGKCPAGYSYDVRYGRCDKCFEGSVTIRPGIMSCQSCPDGSTSNKDRTACIPL